MLTVSGRQLVRYKWLAIFSLVTIALILFGNNVLADTPNENTPQTIVMEGQAAMIAGYRSSQLHLKTVSTDSSGWLLEISLSPIGLRSNDSENPVWNVNGTFTLGMPEQPLVTGTTNGWVDASGKGDIMLSGTQTYSASLAVSFNIAHNGSVAATAQGQWPVLSPQPAQTDTSQSQPANHFFWYLSRSSAIVAYILLFINLCLGVGLNIRYLDKVLKRLPALDLHQFTGILAVGFIFLHIFSILGDSYFNFGLKGLLVPGASPYRPTWDSLGVIGFYALMVTTISCFIRKFIGKTTWRVIHYTSLVIFFVVLIHGIGSGTDTATPWTEWLYLSTGTVLVFLYLVRFLGSRSDRGGSQVPVGNAKLTSPD
jgi:hypothetical protein